MAAIPIQPSELLVSEGEKGASSESQLYRKRTRPTLLLHREEDLFCLLSLTCDCYKLLEELGKSSLAPILVPLIVSLATVVARNVWSHPSRKQSTWMRRASSLALPVMMSLSMNNAASILLFGHLDFNMTILSVVLFAGGCAVRFSSTAVVCDEPIGDSKPPEVGDQAGRSCVASQGSCERDISAPGSISDSWDDSSAVLPSIHRAPTALAQHAGGAGSEMLGFSSGDTMLAYFGGHPHLDLFHVPDHDDDPIPMDYTMSSPTAATFYIDSGASNHMTGNKELFTSADYQGHSEIKEIFVADGRPLRVVGAGSVRSAGINLPRVLHVEGMTCNVLVSVSQLTREHDVEVVFKPECVTIKKLRSKRRVGKGRFKDGMYHLYHLSL